MVQTHLARIAFCAGQEKSSSSTLKRTLSEGSEIDVPTVKREGKRPKVEHEELEAQLELKISAKAGNHHKLEKVSINCPAMS